MALDVSEIREMLTALKIKGLSYFDPSYCQKLVTVVFRRRVRSAFLRL